MQILVVDDEDELTAPLAQVLRREGYQVEISRDGREGLALAQSQAYQLLILDWMLPGVSGLDICQHIKTQGKSTPVLFLTAKDTLDDRVQGLDAGADDYLVKPFEMRELLARVRALLRRSLPVITEPELDSLQIADLSLEAPRQLARRHHRTIPLSEKETQLLAYLMKNAEQLLSHRQILNSLWGASNPPHSNVLAAQIRLLRRKIEGTGEEPLIHTVYGKGYWFGLRPSEGGSR
ncbi:MAG: two-component system response regulator RppA [Prochlorotrichaceae cyanobacterium]|jgi:OmpR-family two-component system manganese-sensing response regulator